MVRALITPETLAEIEAEIGASIDGSTYRWRVYTWDGAEFEFRDGNADGALSAARACLRNKRLEELT